MPQVPVRPEDTLISSMRIPIGERSPEQPSAPKVFRRGRPAGGWVTGHRSAIGTVDGRQSTTECH
jgi:hypothetical protein